jgi:hypothetical protein
LPAAYAPGGIQQRQSRLVRLINFRHHRARDGYTQVSEPFCKPIRK